MCIIRRENTDIDFMQLFLKNAISGDKRYIDIVEPILLDVSDYLNKRKTICELKRPNLRMKLFLIKCKSFKKITKKNLRLNDVLTFIDKKQNDYI